MITIPSNDKIKTEILGNMTTEVSKIEGSYSYDVASASSKSIEENYIYLQNLFPQLFPFFATVPMYLDPRPHRLQPHDHPRRAHPDRFE